MLKAGIVPQDVTLPPNDPIAKRRWDALTPEQKKIQARAMATFEAGTQSSIDGLDDHPVVYVAYAWVSVVPSTQHHPEWASPGDGYNDWQISLAKALR